MATEKYKQWSVVTASTSAFTVCFMVWMMFAVIGIPIKQSLGLNETEFGVLVATPVLTGSLIHRIMPVSLTFDHRAVSGGEAGRFLAAVIADLAMAL